MAVPAGQRPGPLAVWPPRREAASAAGEPDSPVIAHSPGPGLALGAGPGLVLGAGHEDLAQQMISSHLPDFGSPAQ